MGYSTNDVTNVVNAYKKHLVDGTSNSPYAILRRESDNKEYCVKLSAYGPSFIRALTPETLARIAIY